MEAFLTSCDFLDTYTCVHTHAQLPAYHVAEGGEWAAATWL